MDSGRLQHSSQQSGTAARAVPVLVRGLTQPITEICDPNPAALLAAVHGSSQERQTRDRTASSGASEGSSTANAFLSLGGHRPRPLDQRASDGTAVAGFISTDPVATVNRGSHEPRRETDRFCSSPSQLCQTRASLQDVNASSGASEGSSTTNAFLSLGSHRPRPLGQRASDGTAVAGSIFTDPDATVNRGCHEPRRFFP